MAQKLIVVVGATGGQGGAVVSKFLSDKTWKVRGITRNTQSERARALSAKGVEMVQANIDNLVSLDKAFEGATAIFAVTDYYESFWDKGWEKAMEIEYAQGTNMAIAASKVTTLEHYLWSTLPHTSRITNGKALVPHFEAKGRVDDFIRSDKTLLERTTFCLFTTFTNNLIQYDIFKPIYVPAAKKWIQHYPTDPTTTYPLLGDHSVNSGIFVYSLVTNKPPSGAYVRCSVKDYTLESYLAMWGRESGISPDPNSTMVVRLSPEVYTKLYGDMGEEQARQWEFLRILKDSGATNRYGFPVHDVQEFMSKEAIKSLMSPEESVRNVNWKALGF
ncbi:unnamed protein product [Penicillium crustosum]